jgi:hypothetical protein
MRFHRLLSRLALLAALTPGILPAGAYAAAIYDGFGYPPGNEPLAGKNGGTGWGGPWSDTCCAGSTRTTASGLSFGALAVTPGAATTPAGPPPPPETISIHSRAFGTSFGADNTTLFFSFLLRPDANFGFYAGINLGHTGSDFFVGKSGFIPGTTTPVANYSLEGGGMIAQSSVAAVAGTTVLLVMRAQFHDGIADLLDLYVNPTPGGALPAASDATLALPDVGSLDFLFINNASGWTTDEIRLGDTFASVSPTAVPIAPSQLLFLGGLGLIVLARRRSVRA